LVLERIRGIKIDDIAALDAAGYDRHQIARNLARIILKEVLEDAFFHADPHPGNLVVMPGEVIGEMDFGKVGTLSDKDRRELTHCFILAISQDAEGYVEQLIRMGASSEEVDRKGLSQDISRVLIQYQNLPLKDIHVAELLHEILPITDRHDLHMPANLWSTVNMLAMVEGVVLTLDPDFDIFGFCEPYVRKMSMRLAMPAGNWPYELLRQGTEWSDLIHNLPRTGNRLLERVERGQPFQIGLKDAEPIMHQMDRLITEGVIYAPRYGWVEFAIPHFDQYVQRTLPT
jgi:ubiquinone biosynthesis protein